MNVIELETILLSFDPYSGLQVVAKNGELGNLIHGLQSVIDFDKDPGHYHKYSVWEHTLKVVEYSLPTTEVRWAALFHDIAKPLCWSKKDGKVHFLQHDIIGADMWKGEAEQLGLNKKLINTVYCLIKEHQSLRGNIGDKALRRLIHRVGDQMDNLFCLCAADIRAHADFVVVNSLNELDGLHKRVRALGKITDQLPNGVKEMVAEKFPQKEEMIVTKLKKMVVEGTANESTDFFKLAKGLR